MNEQNIFNEITKLNYEQKKVLLKMLLTFEMQDSSNSQELASAFPQKGD